MTICEYDFYAISGYNFIFYLFSVFVTRQCMETILDVISQNSVIQMFGWMKLSCDMAIRPCWMK